VNKIDSYSTDWINGLLKDLESKALLFNIKIDEEKFYIIPDEIADKLKNIYGVELQDNKYEELLNNYPITNQNKYNFLESVGIPTKGINISDEINIKIIANQLKPSEFLNSLGNDTHLYEICKRNGIKTTGTKVEKIKWIIENFQKIEFFKKETTDSREILYKYYDDLANRKEYELITKHIITKGEDIGKKFEEATDYLFEKIIGLTLKTPKGRKPSNNPDGVAIKDNDLIIWDCKTKDKYFTLNTDERRQFTEYINNYKKSDEGKLICLLVITNDIKNKDDVVRELRGIMLETDTHICVIKANDLKNFAEKIKKDQIEINLKLLFYKTGLIDYKYLENLCR
jgi:hypothetical protein